jgi:hypothetical protein
MKPENSIFNKDEFINLNVDKNIPTNKLVESFKNKPEKNIFENTNSRVLRKPNNIERELSQKIFKVEPEKLLKSESEYLKNIAKDIPLESTEDAITKRVSGISKNIEAKSIENGMVNKGFGELAEYNSSTLKQQSEIVSNMMKTDFDKVKRIAIGEESLPMGMKPATPLSAMEDYAMATKNGELAKQLAKSPLNTQISEAASEVSLSRLRNKDSASFKINEIIKERENAAVKKMKGVEPDSLKRNIRKSLDDNIKRTQPNKYSWSKFLEDIKC